MEDNVLVWLKYPRVKRNVISRRQPLIVNNKHSLFTINLINYTIYLPKGRKFKNYERETKINNEICEYNMQYNYKYNLTKN